LLHRAAEQLGGVEELARYLQVSEVRVRIWQRGAIPLPDDIFLRLVDLLIEPTPRGTGPAGRAPGADSSGS
jgi:hypothetical protein